MQRAGWAAALAFVCSLFLGASQSKLSSPTSYYTIDISDLGYTKLEDLKSEPGIKWWVEAGRTLLVLASRDFATNVDNLAPTELPFTAQPEKLVFIQGGHKNVLRLLKGDVLVKSGRIAVLQLAEAFTFNHDRHHHANTLPFRPNTVLAKLASNDLPQQTPPFVDTVGDIVAEIDGERWFSDVAHLASLNRHTGGDEIDAARDWLVAQFQALGLETTTHEFDAMGTHGFNVIATLRGTERPDDVYIVGGHYDSTSENVRSAAPGAEDNASGTAGVLEMARAFVKHPPKATIMFMAFSGEEQGLVGSNAYVKQMVTQGQGARVKAAITMDMIGFDANDNLDCLLETSSTYKFITDHLTQAAAQFTKLEILTTFNPFGSDHMSFINQDIPAILTIENDWGDYPSYHRTTDTPENISVAMGFETLKMNTAGLAQWVN